MASQVARVVVGYGRLNRHQGLDFALPYQLGDELAVVQHLVVSAEMRILVLDGVEAVRADGDYLLHVVAFERLDVLLG